MIELARTKRDWRPQEFGRRRAQNVSDPLIEPLWTGIRVLVHVEAGSTAIVDPEGTAVQKRDVAEALARAVRASTAVLDGYLTTEVSRSAVGLAPIVEVESANARDYARQMLIGRAGDRSRTLAARAEEIEAELRMADAVLSGTEDAALVAIDLLELDGESLLDVPLLERKRLLDAVVHEEDLVRIGIHVRPPIDSWLATWRMIGIRTLAFKAANSRYRPGEANDDWAEARIPQR